ncbi:MAG: MotA/TolQ/ExbB proton channel family protein [Thermosynechococcaceae cyanobacterium MS004]|nr:MotA/TolQ/ExbB proton channel family protein [Thermosynechococcaceae cyanobacterium MS004]
MSIGQLFAAGGIVMWPLMVSSVLAIALIAERLRFWYRVNRRQKRFLREVIDLYRREPELIVPKLNQYIDLPMARIFLAAVQLDEPNPEEFRLGLESEAQAEIPLLKRFTVIFETIIALAPLLGLLGTILGLITTFSSLEIGSIGGSQTTGVTAGISEALVSTATGMIVAIVVLVFANLFRGLYQRQVALIQEYGGQLELVYRHRFENDRSPVFSGRAR